MKKYLVYIGPETIYNGVNFTKGKTYEIVFRQGENYCDVMSDNNKQCFFDKFYFGVYLPIDQHFTTIDKYRSTKINALLNKIDE